MSDAEPLSMFPDEYPPSLDQAQKIIVREHLRRVKRMGPHAPQTTAGWINWTEAHHPGMTISQGKVMWLMDHIDRPVTDDDLVVLARTYRIRISDSGLRSRRHELATLGHIVPDGETRTPSRRRATCWSLA